MSQNTFNLRLHIDPILLHKSNPSKSINCSKYLPYYCNINNSNKHAPQIPKMTCQNYLTCINLGGMPYATYEHTGTNHVTRNVVHNDSNDTDANNNAT